MAFFIHTVDHGKNIGLEYMTSGTLAAKVGLALKLTGGKLALASGTDKPSYICMKEGAVKDGEVIPVIRASEDIIFATTNSADFQSINVGSKVTLHTNGLEVTATTVSGVAEVVKIGANEVGSDILVRFA